MISRVFVQPENCLHLTLEKLLLKIGFVFSQMSTCLQCYRPGLSLLERCHVTVFAGCRVKIGTEKQQIRQNIE